MQLKHVVYGMAVLFLTGCFSAKLVTPAQTDVDRVQSKFQNYTLADLNHGKSLFEQNCRSCHGLKNPTSRTEEKWNTIVPRMVAKVNRKKTVLSEKDQEDIRRYLVTMSSAPKAK